MTAYSNPVGMFNRYKYAANNPYRFIDPDGRQEKTDRPPPLPIGKNTTAKLAAGAYGGTIGPVGNARGFTKGEAVRANFDRNIERSPLGPGGKDAMRFLGEDLVKAMGDVIDGNYTSAIASAAAWGLAKPLKPLSGRLTYLYQKLDSNGGHLKFGITANPLTRYSSSELAGGRLNIIASGNRSNMLQLERNLHETLPIGPEERQIFYIQKQVEKGLDAPPY